MTEEEKYAEERALELRKVKALEKIGNSLDALTIWFEEIDKDDWNARMQFYMSEWYKTLKDNNPKTFNDTPTTLND